MFLNRLRLPYSIPKSFALLLNIHCFRVALTAELSDVLLLDISMPDGDGVAFCKELAEKYPSLKVVILTVHDEYSLVKRILECEVAGYVLKSITTEELAKTIRHVQEGKKHICAELISMIRKRSSTEVSLTEREEQILRLLTEGYNSGKIAKTLFISEKTVKWHRKNLLNKFGASNTSVMVSIAIKKKLL